MNTQSASYNLHTRLTGHAQLVLCLDVTRDGMLLASGGGDGTFIWDLEEMKMVQQITTFGTRGGTTSLLWIHQKDTLEDGLVYGTHNGYVVLCKQSDQGVEEIDIFQVAEPGEITSVAFDSSSSRLAVSSRNGIVQMVVIEPSKMHIIHNVWTRKIENCIPKTLAFDQRRDLLVFGMHDAVYCLDNGTGSYDLRRCKTHGMRVGHATCATDWYLVENIFDGSTLHRLSDHALLKAYNVPRRRQIAAPKQVVFGEDHQIVVNGSDHGVLYVFDLRTGAVLQKLDTETGNWVQALTTVQVNGVPFIIAGEARAGEGGSDIFIFKKTGLLERSVQCFLKRAKQTFYGGAVIGDCDNSLPKLGPDQDHFPSHFISTPYITHVRGFFDEIIFETNLLAWI
ncbi:hypothetical protein PQX77_017691 [Marasmius sp. AFHP31]|nr:hypothetical protein PQX77_017691 [Marasmius sp. AFHP31]